MGSWMEDSSCTDWSQFRMVKYYDLQLSICVFITVGLLVLICLIHFKVECKRDILHGYRYRGVIEFFVSNINLDNEVVLYFLKNRILKKHTLPNMWKVG